MGGGPSRQVTQYLQWCVDTYRPLCHGSLTEERRSAENPFDLAERMVAELVKVDKAYRGCCQVRCPSCPPFPATTVAVIARTSH